jgi:hypothetical protein
MIETDDSGAALRIIDFCNARSGVLQSVVLVDRIMSLRKASSMYRSRSNRIHR